jgi:hypothetical protein
MTKIRIATVSVALHSSLFEAMLTPKSRPFDRDFIFC